MKADLNELCRTPIPWLEGNPFDSDVAVSTRIRLARNIEGVPFPGHADPSVSTAVRDSVTETLQTYLPDYEADWMELRMNECSRNERNLLFERRCISPEFNREDGTECLLMKRGECQNIMVNEEDHLRIQFFAPGFRLKNLWREMDEFDDLLSEHIPYAFDETLGFLTSCPTNLGTGMRASVMLHLPGLTMTGQMKQLLNALGQLHLTIRGFRGEGSSVNADLYQISNQSTLGESEWEIIERLSNVVSRVIISERAARSLLLGKQEELLLDRIGRAYGILKHAFLISSEEALEQLFLLRLGVMLGVIDHLAEEDIADLLRQIQVAHLQQEYGPAELSSRDRGILRARILRERLSSK